jgi:hypothetical protein
MRRRLCNAPKQHHKHARGRGSHGFAPPHGLADYFQSHGDSVKTVQLAAETRAANWWLAVVGHLFTVGGILGYAAACQDTVFHAHGKNRASGIIHGRAALFE